MTEASRPRWFTDTDDNHSQWYVERFRTLAAEGADYVVDATIGVDLVDGELCAELHVVTERGL